MKKIGVMTTSRADYGLYLPVLKKLAAHPQMALQLFVTGAHLSPAHGMTVKNIREDGFSPTAEVNIHLEDTPAGIVRAMGEVTAGFAEILYTQRPDVLLVLGDRYEMHAAALAAIPLGIPLAHIHGGELTYGAIDEFFRHSLTKLSALHFAATEIYAKRIRQMGEDPGRVFVVGSPGIDNVLQIPLWEKRELQERLALDCSCPIFLVTFHPVTLEGGSTRDHVEKFLSALEQFPQFQIVFTQPNADPESQIIVKHIASFVQNHQRAVFIPHLGQRGYLSLMKHAAAMIGNSSSGIIEAPSFHLPVVNIGTRQGGRLRACNVIDAGYEPGEIVEALKRACSDDFRAGLKTLENPYGDGRAAERIVQILEQVDLNQLRDKKFFDL